MSVAFLAFFALVDAALKSDATKPQLTTKGGQAATKAVTVPLDSRSAELARLNREATDREIKLCQDATLEFEMGKTSQARVSTESLIASGNSDLVLAEAERLLGRIALEEGKYVEALPLLIGDGHLAREDRSNLDIALCYSKMGQNDKALDYYREEITNEFGLTQDLLPRTPGAGAIEAKILLSRGLVSYHTSSASSFTLALKDFRDAGRLDPRCPATAYYTSKTLFSLQRNEQALPFLIIASYRASGLILRETKARLNSYPLEQRETTAALVQSHPASFYDKLH